MANKDSRLALQYEPESWRDSESWADERPLRTHDLTLSFEEEEFLGGGGTRMQQV